MKQNTILVVTSLLSILLLTLHITDDIVRGISKAESSNTALIVLVVLLYGTVVLAERRSGMCRYVPVIAEATDHQNCVRTVSHTPRNPGVTPLFTGTQRGTPMLREGVDGNCVDAIWCASARASGTNFQACSFNHSDISPCEWNQ